MYGFIAEINDCYVSVYPPKVVPTCSFVVVTKCISSLKKLFLHLFELLEAPILLEKVHKTPAYLFKLFPVLQSSFAKELSSTIIEFLCIALLEVKITEVKDCRFCSAALINFRNKHFIPWVKIQRRQK